MLETRRCAIAECREHCPTSHLMCIKHWRMVPAALRSMVRMAYQTWRRAVSGNRPMQMKAQRAEELRKAQGLAIAAVIEKEVKRDLKRQEGQEPLFSE